MIIIIIRRRRCTSCRSRAIAARRYYDNTHRNIFHHGQIKRHINCASEDAYSSESYTHAGRGGDGRLFSYGVRASLIKRRIEMCSEHRSMAIMRFTEVSIFCGDLVKVCETAAHGANHVILLSDYDKLILKALHFARSEKFYHNIISY